MENPKKTNHKLNDIANIMDDILSNMKSHIKHIQKKDGDKNAPQIYKDVDPNTFDQSRTLQNILNYTLKDPIYMKNGNKDEALLTDIEKKEILANAFIKINPYLKSPNTNLAQSINPNLNTLEELIQQTNKDIALGKNPTKTVPPKSSLHKQATETTNLLTNKTDSSQSNRLSRKTTTKYSNQQKSTSYNNNVKPIIVTTKVQNSQSPINEIKPRSSSSQKRKASEKIDSKQQTQSISSKATTNRRSVQNSPPTSERSGTRKPLNDVNNNSTNFRSRSLSVQNDTTNPRNIQTNKYFNETRRPSTAVPVTRGKPTTAVSSTRDRLTTAMVKNKPSAAISSKDRPSTNTSSKNRSSAAKTSMPFKIQSSTAKSNIKPLSKISPTRDKVASPVPIAKGRPMSMDSKLRPQNQGKLDTKTFPQKTSNKITTRTRSMDSKPVSRPEAPKIFPKIISNDSNNYSLSNDSKNTMRKEFSGVKNHEFIKDLTKQISQVIRKNNQMLMEKRAIYVQGTIPSNFIVNRAVTSVEKKIDQLIKPISTNVINQIISKQNSAQTKVINQPVNSDIFPSKSENKKEINNNEIHKLIPTNTKLIENIEKSNYHVNKTIEKQLENVESITKKSVSFQNRKPVGPPKVVIEQQNRPQTSPFLGNWLQTPERKPQTSAGAQILHEKRGIQSSPTLELKRDEEGTKIFPQQIHIEKSKTSAETPAVLAENNEQNIESINEINKQIEQMMIQVVGPKMENSKENTPSNLNEETPKLNILDPVKSKQEKEEPPKPQSQIIVPCAKKSSRYTSKSTNFFKPFTPESKYSFQKKLSIIPLAPMSKRFLPTPMELVQDFINMVAQAKKAKKTYTVCGNFFALRRAFAERGWIEKMRINIMDDKESWRKIESLTNYELVEGIRNKEYGEKYRRMFLTKLLAGHQVDFYWDYLTNPFNINNDRIKRTLINRFPYGATRSYTTKHGLSESLKESHWFRIEGYANILFPRTYNLAIDEEIKSFIDDFRITGAISLLQWILNTTSDKVQSAEGTIPISVFNFATMQCHHFLKEREHRDIDELIPMTKDCEWDVFLDKYYKLVHFDHMFQKNDKISIEAMIDQSRYIMNKIKKYLPDVNIDGYRNMWLLKPNNGSRGYGILVCRTLKYMLDAINSKKDIKYIVQKYIERPLLIRKTKFDIRQWFLITCMPNVKIWMYKENYLRFSSQVFDLSKLHESIHLTNNSIQSRYKNHNNRSNILPEQNMWHSDTFRRYLADIGHPYNWRNVIYKGMKECLIGLFMLCQDKLETRVNSFELCGADFMLDENFKPYLIEINSRPALYPSTKITAKMCPKVLEDVIKVVIDNARNPKASTGEFELIYTDTFNYAIPRHENTLHMKGVNYFHKYAKTQYKPDQSSSIKNIQSVKILPQIQTQQENDVNSESLQKFLNLDAARVRADVKKTLEKILGVINSCDGNAETNKDKAMKRSKQLRAMLSEFVNIISSSAGKNKTAESKINFV